MRLFTGLILLCGSTSMSATMLIEELSLIGSTIHVRINESFKEEYLTDDFFVTYDATVDLTRCSYTQLSMPFIMNVISLVWISGNVYEIEEMDSELHESLIRLKNIFQIMYPRTRWHGELRPKKLVTHTSLAAPDSSRIALLFSGGVDSLSASLYHHNTQQLLITAWGHWDLPLDNNSLWHTRSQKIAAYAHTTGNDSTHIRSNYTSILNYRYLATLSPEIHKWRLSTVEGIGWAGLVAPILASTGITTLHIGSSHTWHYPYPTAASPIIDHALRFCGCRVVHDEFDKTRLAKIHHLHNELQRHHIPIPFLRVCSLEKERDRNCQTCRKCLSTILCFQALQIDPAPYGLHYSDARAEQILDLFSQSSLHYYTIELGKEVQRLVMAHKQSGIKVDDLLAELLNIDFSRTAPCDTRKQRKLHWATMLDLLPSDHGLDVPTWLRKNS